MAESTCTLHSSFDGILRVSATCFIVITADDVRLRTQSRQLVHMLHDVDAMTGESWTDEIGI
jgi:hypothetical protein